MAQQSTDDDWILIRFLGKSQGFIWFILDRSEDVARFNLKWKECQNIQLKKTHFPYNQQHCVAKETDNIFKTTLQKWNNTVNFDVYS